MTQIAATSGGPSTSVNESPHSRLPIPPTPLIGRAQDIDLGRARLLQSGVRLLTLIGPGGTGKTRLAIAVAESVRDVFADGVWFVDLSATIDAALVLREIAHHLGVHDDNDRPVRERLHQHLAGRNALLVLDNLEPVLSAAPDLAALVNACPSVKLLVTSREPLHVHVESQFTVRRLALPDLAHLPARRSLEHVPAVELYLQRAHAAGANLQLDDSFLNPPEVSITVPICGDSADEGTFAGLLSDVVNTQCASDSCGALGGITDDDVAPTPTLSVANDSERENDFGFEAARYVRFVVSLQPTSASQVTVQANTALGDQSVGPLAKGGSSCFSGVDYDALSQQVRFEPGETSKVVAVLICPDLTNEPNENFALVLSAPNGATIGDGRATGLIVDDD